MSVFESLPQAGMQYQYAGGTAMLPPSPVAAIKTMEAEVADLRDAIFALSDAARRALPGGTADLHVSLQSASNKLGDAERLLHAAGRS